MKWHWYEAIGYVGSIFMFMTFFMKTMIPLRITAITANIVMIVYTALAGILPVLILQSCLLPLNILRFVQMRRLIQRVKAAARGDFSIDPLLPFMKPERRKEGDVLFKAGDRGDRVYYIQQGKVQLEEVGVTIDQGAVFGE
ncbi:MAG TPA: cyclic nucleotide-binding domain-containing protein, partial [Kofleriaceae bacterium]